MHTLVGFLAGLDMKLRHVACQQHLHVDAVLVIFIYVMIDPYRSIYDYMWVPIYRIGTII